MIFLRPWRALVALRAFPVLVLLVLGAAAGWVVFTVTLGTPRIGLLRIDTILVNSTADDILRLLKAAEEDRRMRAVVVELDSLGGTVTASEELYYQFLRLQRHKPVVTYVRGWAVSGGYYVAAATNEIVANPASKVGNIGVVTFLPSRDEPDEDIVPSGPRKFEGWSRGERLRQLELMKESFLEAVVKQRGERLKLNRAQLATGRVFLGMEGVNNGLIDRLGNRTVALEQAARLAGLATYEVWDLNKALGIKELGRQEGAQARSLLPEDSLPAQSYYLYLERR